MDVGELKTVSKRHKKKRRKLWTFNWYASNVDMFYAEPHVKILPFPKNLVARKSEEMQEGVSCIEASSFCSSVKCTSSSSDRLTSEQFFKRSPGAFNKTEPSDWPCGLMFKLFQNSFLTITSSHALFLTFGKADARLVLDRWLVFSSFDPNCS